MIGNIIVAIVCNLIFLLILASGVFSSLKNGWKVSLAKFGFVMSGFWATYLLTPALSEGILSISSNGMHLKDVIIPEYLTLGAFNSIIFTFLFLIFYGIALLGCKLLKIQLINDFKDKKLVKVKMIKAKSVNPKAEKMERKAIKK
jgi:hypothetical protein